MCQGQEISKVSTPTAAAAKSVAVSKVTQVQVQDDQQEVVCSTSVALPGEVKDFLPESNAPAIASVVDSESAVTFNELRMFLQHGCENLISDIEPQSVVGILMRNGPELAVAILLCMQRFVAAPLDPNMSVLELVQAFQQLNVKHALVLQGHKVYDDNIQQAAIQANCQLKYVMQSGSKAGLFLRSNLKASATMQLAQIQTENAKAHWNTWDNTGLMLRTSGTTSKPKVVPLTLRGLYTGAMCIGSGLGLTSADKCLNVMPFTHIGGISCNLLATLVTGGQVICAPSFDPARFTHWLDQMAPTWYYAVPTIHKALVMHCKGLLTPPAHNLRFVRSGAANLPHSDAKELHELFGCNVYPTYSMSECMPIAQPLAGYDLSKPGSVGVPIASSLRIVDDAGGVLPRGQPGEVCIRGPVVTKGYLGNPEANAASFFGDQDSQWFRTGDVGVLDSDGYLFLTGRVKELIKRGGEQVSPYEVEEALMTHPAVQVAVVFGVPNDFWGEEVAAAVTLKPEYPRANSREKSADVVGQPVLVGQPKRSYSKMSLSQSEGKQDNAKIPADPQTIAKFAADILAEYKVPKQIVILGSAEELPKTRTGKYQRIGLHSHLGLAAVDIAAEERLKPTLFGSGEVPPPVKPDPAIYGLRFFLAIWVMFMHLGKFPTEIEAWRGMSMSMMGFFILAGFLLASSTTRPIEDKWNFYRNRIVAAHPLYLLAVCISLPIVFWEKSSRLNGDFGGFFMDFLYSIIVMVFGQQAWPWGLPAQKQFGNANGPLWFSSAYYFCLMIFPFVHRWLAKRTFFNWCCRGKEPTAGSGCCSFNLYCCWPVCGCISIINCCTAITFVAYFVIGAIVLSAMGLSESESMEQAVMGAYMLPPIWAGIFTLGVFLFNLFELARRGKTDEELWPHWGKVADALTFVFFLTLLAASGLASANEDLAGLLGAMWSRPLRLGLCFVCLWIYALATGKGLTARLFRNRLLVKYVSPASYVIYLIHWPVGTYFMKLVDPDCKFGKECLDSIAWYNFFVLALLVTLLAMFLQHFVSAPLTTCFMRCFDACLSCCRCRSCGQKGFEEDASTLVKVIHAVQGLTGADVDGTTPLAECGLDSFGTSALVGVLRAKIPGVVLSPLRIYELHTIAEVAEEIEKGLDSGEANGDAAV